MVWFLRDIFIVCSALNSVCCFKSKYIHVCDVWLRYFIAIFFFGGRYILLIEFPESFRADLVTWCVMLLPQSLSQRNLSVVPNVLLKNSNVRACVSLVSSSSSVTQPYLYSCFYLRWCFGTMRVRSILRLNVIWKWCVHVSTLHCFHVTQAGKEVFNKAMLMNAAVLETLRLQWVDCFIFHDVDMVPEDDRIPYHCPNYPRHMSVALNKHNYQ